MLLAEDERAIKGSKYFTKQVSQDFKKLEQSLTTHHTRVKSALLKKALQTEGIQSLLVASATAIKEAKEFMQEHSRLKNA